MPRRTPGRTMVAEDNARATIKRLLEEQERSTAWLARKMTEAGCATSAQCAWKIVNTDRTIYVNEAIAIAAVLDMPIEELVA